MNRKKLGRRLIAPPAWVTVSLTVISGIALAAVFCRGWEQTVAAYLVYGISFYTLCCLVFFFIKVFPEKRKKLRARLQKNALGNRYLTDKVFRKVLSLYGSLAISLLFAGVHLWSWYRLRSWWFMVLAGYYGILAVMRFLLVRYVRLHPIGTDLPGEWRRARLCACILLLVNLSLSGAVLMILYQGRGYDYPGMLIYVMALYGFYALTVAFVNLIKYRKAGSPVMGAANTVSLSAALVSLLNLETAMFAQFGGQMAPGQQQLFIILTGAGISIAIVTLSVLRIVSATKEIRRERNGK